MLPQNFNLDEYKDWQKLLAISGSVLISEALSAPLERLKVKVQATPPVNSKTFKQTEEVRSVVKDVGKKRALLNLYHGFKPSFDHQLFLNNTRFYSYYFTMDYLFKNRKHDFSYLDVFGSSVVATTMGTFFSQPSDIVRIQAQREEIGKETPRKIEPIFKMRKIIQYKKKTGRSLPGLSVNVMVQNINALTELFTFFALKNALTKMEYFQSNYAINGISVLAATGISTFISAPLELAYTRTIFRALDAKEISWKKDMASLIKHEGFRGLYKAYLPYFCRTAVFNFSMVTLLEFFCTHFKSQQDN